MRGAAQKPTSRSPGSPHSEPGSIPSKTSGRGPRGPWAVRSADPSHTPAPPSPVPEVDPWLLPVVHRELARDPSAGVTTIAGRLRWPRAVVRPAVVVLTAHAEPCHRPRPYQAEIRRASETPTAAQMWARRERPAQSSASGAARLPRILHTAQTSLARLLGLTRAEARARIGEIVRSAVPTTEEPQPQGPQPPGAGPLEIWRASATWGHLRLVVERRTPTVIRICEVLPALEVIRG